MGLSKLYIKTILIVVIYYGENETCFDCIVLGNHCNYDKILILQIVTNIDGQKVPSTRRKPQQEQLDNRHMDAVSQLLRKSAVSQLLKTALEKSAVLCHHWLPELLDFMRNEQNSS